MIPTANEVGGAALRPSAPTRTLTERGEEMGLKSEIVRRVLEIPLDNWQPVLEEWDVEEWEDKSGSFFPDRFETRTAGGALVVLYRYSEAVVESGHGHAVDISSITYYHRLFVDGEKVAEGVGDGDFFGLFRLPLGWLYNPLGWLYNRLRKHHHRLLRHRRIDRQRKRRRDRRTEKERAAQAAAAEAERLRRLLDKF